jgi:hypothetical protein
LRKRWFSRATLCPQTAVLHLLGRHPQLRPSMSLRDAP